MHPDTEAVATVTPRPVPPGWVSLREDTRTHALIYTYADGSEHVMTQEELHAYVYPNPQQ
jgi:hypothetical protein